MLYIYIYIWFPEKNRNLHFFLETVLLKHEGNIFFLKHTALIEYKDLV